MANTTQNLSPLAVNERQAAMMLSVSTRTMFSLRRGGRIEYIKMGDGAKAKLLYPVAALEKFIRENSQVGASK